MYLHSTILDLNITMSVEDLTNSKFTFHYFRFEPEHLKNKIFEVLNLHSTILDLNPAFITS